MSTPTDDIVLSDPEEFTYCTVINFHDGFQVALVAPSMTDLKYAFNRITGGVKPLHYELVQDVKLSKA